MDNPLQFGGAVMIGFAVLELVLGPVIARTTGMPPGTVRVFVITGAVTLALGGSMLWVASIT